MKKWMIAAASGLVLIAFFIFPMLGRGKANAQQTMNQLIELYKQPESEVVESLGLSDPVVDGPYSVYHKEISWLGEKLETEVTFRDGAPFSFIGKKTYPDTEKTEQLARNTLAQFEELLGDPGWCAFAQDGSPVSYGISEQDEVQYAQREEIKEKGVESIFSEKTNIGEEKELCFRFVFPGSEREDRCFIECAFYRAEDTPDQITFAYRIYHFFKLVS